MQNRPSAGATAALLAAVLTAGTCIALTAAVLVLGGNDQAPEAASPPAARITLPPTPDPANWAAYIDALTAIDPDIVHGKDEKAVDRGRNQCTSVAQWPDDESKLIYLVQQRFTSPDHPEGFGPQKSALILDAIRTHIC